MDISAYCYRRVDTLDVALFNENLSGFRAEVFDLLLAYDLAFSQLFYLLVELTHYVIIRLRHISLLNWLFRQIFKALNVQMGPNDQIEPVYSTEAIEC